MPDWIFWMPPETTLYGMALFAASIWIAHVLTTLGAAAFFRVMHKRNILPERRVANGKPPPDKLIRLAWIDRAIAYPAYLGVLALILYPMFAWRGAALGLEWPGLGEMALHIALSALINETIFYWGHRLLHNKRMFRLVHRKHHAFRQVRTVSCEYAHPLENLLNLIALYAGPLMLGSALPTLIVWETLRMIETCDAHSGYDFDSVASRHAFHHRYPTKGCYGTGLGLWDWLMGTDNEWREKRAA